MLRFTQDCVNSFVGGFIQGAKDAIALGYAMFVSYERKIDALVAAKKK